MPAHKQGLACPVCLAKPERYSNSKMDGNCASLCGFTNFSVLMLVPLFQK